MTKTGTETVEKTSGNSKSAATKAGTRKKAASSARRTSLTKKLKEVEAERDRLKDQLLRKAAEFDNYKKRTENEIGQILVNANAELITELLPVLDDLERSLQSDQSGASYESLKKGVELIYRNLSKILERRGVRPIEAVGQEFDPEKHEALMQVENKEFPSGTVVEEHLKGYEMNGRVLRHAQVLVNK
ncbi:MAG: nucleotide exchange factor GrpE [Calditrichaeota bacterium]|nr:MAG: nucleotide exchange factor GrpE [Calditrichota bacterium]